MYNQLIRSSLDEKLFLIQLLFDGRLQPLKYRLLKILLNLQLIYNIYSKIDSNKLSFKTNEVMREESLKQFLIVCF